MNDFFAKVNRILAHHGCERGLAILTAIFMMVVFAFLGIATVAIITGSSQTSTDEYFSQQALFAADAGVAYTAKTLSTISDWSNETGFTKNFGAGSFTIAYVSKTATTATIRSSGTVGGITRTIEQQFEKGGGLSTAFENALYTSGNIVAEGSSEGDVSGPVSTGGSITGGGDLEFDSDPSQNDPNVSIPQPDWPYWQSQAENVVNGNHTFASGTYNGDYFVDGNVEFGANVTLNGFIAALGTVNFTGNSNININAVQPNPAIIAEGSVSFSGTSDVAITGFIFTLASLTMTGNSGIDVSGGMIAGGDITFSGNTEAEVVYAPVSGVVPGFSGGEGTEPIIFLQWQEVY